MILFIFPDNRKLTGFGFLDFINLGHIKDYLPIGILSLRF